MNHQSKVGFRSLQVCVYRTAPKELRLIAARGSAQGGGINLKMYSVSLEKVGSKVCAVVSSCKWAKTCISSVWDESREVLPSWSHSVIYEETLSSCFCISLNVFCMCVGFFQRLSFRADVGEDPSAWRLHRGLHRGEAAGRLHGPLPAVPLTLGEPAARQPEKHSQPGSDTQNTRTDVQADTLLLMCMCVCSPLQVTLSYGMFENKMNSIEVKGSFSKEDDPSRFVHHLMNGKICHIILRRVFDYCCFGCLHRYVAAITCLPPCGLLNYLELM